MSAPDELLPRFGVWAPVYGTWGGTQHPEDVPDASYARTRDLVRLAEDVGFRSVLLAEHIVNPGRPDFDVLETWTACAALADATSEIEIIAAVKPLLFHPGVLAKQAVAIDRISGGRFAVNLVSAWFRPEMAKLGIEMPAHDDRYSYSREWLTIVQDLFAGDPVDHRGEWFEIEGLQLLPPPVRTGGPTVYLGGESEAARALAADRADVFFINGRPFDQTVAVIEDLRRRPRAGAPLRFGLSAFVIARETDEEAWDEYTRLQELANLDDRSSVFQGTDPDVAMMKVNAGQPRVGTNGGTLAGLIGGYDRVTERIQEFAEAGVELFMLQFQPLEAEVARFGEHVIPRVRERVRVAAPSFACTPHPSEGAS
jgi:alkanesulfonate monooxygenase